MLEQEERKQADYAEFLKDKLMIDQIVQKIYDEDAAAAKKINDQKVSE